MSIEFSTVSNDNNFSVVDAAAVVVVVGAFVVVVVVVEVVVDVDARDDGDENYINNIFIYGLTTFIS